MSTATMDAVREIRALAHEFASAELRPHVEAWDTARALPPEVLSQLAELGFFGMRVPERYGGMEFDLPTYLAVLEELAWGEPAVALLVSIHSAFACDLLLRHGSEAQKETWLPRLASGEVRGCFALSEAGAGSDPSAVAATARRTADGWVLSGTKKWVSHGRGAGLAIVAARMDPAADQAGLGLFVVPTDAEGYRPGDRETTMGLRCVEVLDVHLDDVTLPEEALLGQPGAGLRQALEALQTGRLGVAAQAAGIARAALEHAVAYAAERRQFERPLRDFEGIQFKLADMATRVEGSRALLERAAAQPSPGRASMAKLFASESAMWVTTQAVQVFGGYGYMRDYPVEKLMRDAKATEIYEGTNEIQRLVIARELYR